MEALDYMRARDLTGDIVGTLGGTAFQAAIAEGAAKVGYMVGSMVPVPFAADIVAISIRGTAFFLGLTATKELTGKAMDIGKNIYDATKEWLDDNLDEKKVVENEARSLSAEDIATIVTSSVTAAISAVLKQPKEMHRNADGTFASAGA